MSLSRASGEPSTLAVQAFYLARTGRPGPVLIDVPKDVQQQLAVPDWDVPMAISGYMQRLPQMPSTRVRSSLLHDVNVSSGIQCGSNPADTCVGFYLKLPHSCPPLSRAVTMSKE